MKMTAVVSGVVGTILAVLVWVVADGQAAPAVRSFGGDRIVVSASMPGLTVQDRLTYQKLDQTIVSFSFTDQPLEEAIDFLATLGGVNIVLDRRKVEAGKTITLKLTNVPLATAVKLITEQVELKWIVREGIVFISDEEGTRREPVTIVYDVADFLAVPPDFKGPDIQLDTISGNRGGSRGSSGGGFSPFAEDQEDKDSPKSREELLQELVDLIKSVIEPGSWDETGS